MTVLAPEFLQTTKYSAQRMRQMQAAAGGPLQEGIVNVGDFKVAQRGAGANMSVDVAAGDAWVQGDNTARQGTYHVGNDATVNVAIAAAHATNPRIDQVVLRIYDSTVIGGEKDLAVIEVVSGTATAGASLSNLTGAAALPSSAIRLAYVLVPAAATKIETASIGNLVDPRRGLTGYPAAVAPLAVAEAPPQYAMGRPAGYVPMARAFASAQQIPGANVGCPLNSESWDTDGMHDLVTNNSRLTAKTPGLYAIEVGVGFSEPSTLQVRVNGTQNIAQGGDLIRQSITTSYRLGYGDYVEMTESSGKIFGFASGLSPRLSARWEGP